MNNSNVFSNLYSLKDASVLWHINESVLRKNIKNKKFIVDVDVKKFGKQWVVTKSAMEKVYGVLESGIIKNNYDSSKLKAINYFVSECLIKYSLKSKKSIKACVNDFKKYNIIHYIFDCYELLEEGPIENVVKDISSRIRRGVVYESRI